MKQSTATYVSVGNAALTFTDTKLPVGRRILWTCLSGMFCLHDVQIDNDVSVTVKG